MLEQKVKMILDEVVQFPNLIYALKVDERPGSSYIEVTIDNLENKFGSVSIEDCERISRELSHRLETEAGDLDFSLSVSSVGAERPLKLPEDLERFMGLDVKLTYKSVDGKELTGIFKLLAVGETVTLGEYGTGAAKNRIKKEMNIDRKDILKGNLYIKI